jgi:hypothetical protein
VINPIPKSTIWKVPLPPTPTLLLTNLYETLIMARNCEVSRKGIPRSKRQCPHAHLESQVPTEVFWSKYDTTTSAGYTTQDIEHTLGTVGVECNTQVSGDW